MWTVPEDNKESLLPSEIKLSRSDAGSLTLEMTKSNAADKVKSYSLNYEITCGEKKKKSPAVRVELDRLYPQLQ